MMNFAWLRRLALGVLVVACVACGGGGDKANDDAAGGSGSSASAGAATTAVPGATDPGGAPASSTDAAGTPGDQSSSQPSDTQPSGDQPAPTTPPGGGGGGGGTSGPQPVQPGTYLYKQSGGITKPLKIDSPSQGKLVVEAALPDGSQTSHRYIDQSQPPSDTTTRFGADGMFIMSTTLRAQGVVVTCTFGSGVAAPPWPPVVGAPISGHGTCDQGTTDVTGSITGTTTATVGGATVEVYLIQTHITAVGQSLKADVYITASFAPSLRLVVHDDTAQVGTFNGVPFEGHTYSDLVSAIPS